MDLKRDRQQEDGSSMESDPERQPPDPEDPRTAALPADASPDDQEASEDLPDRPPFPHPQWMVGVVLIFAVLFIAGGLGNPDGVNTESLRSRP